MPGTSGTNRSASPQATNATPRIAPVIQVAGRISSSWSPRPPPRPAPPRLPAWNHALVRPTSAGGVVAAMIDSIAMPTIELSRLAKAMTARSAGRVSSLIRIADIRKTPSAEATVPIRYQRLGPSVTSTAGAHVHLSHWLMNCAPFRSDASVIDRPFFVARNVSATPTKPLIAPKGRYRTVQTTGWATVERFEGTVRAA